MNISFKSFFLSFLISSSILLFVFLLRDLVEKDIKGKNIIFYVDNAASLNSFSKLITSSVKRSLTEIIENAYYENTLVNFEIWYTPKNNLEEKIIKRSVEESSIDNTINSIEFYLNDRIINRFDKILTVLENGDYTKKDNFIILFSNFNERIAGHGDEIKNRCSQKNTNLYRVFPVIIPTGNISSMEVYKLTILNSIESCSKEKISYIILQEKGKSFDIYSSKDNLSFISQLSGNGLDEVAVETTAKKISEYINREIFKEIRGVVRFKTTDVIRLNIILFWIFLLFMAKKWTKEDNKYKPSISDYISLPFLVIYILIFFINLLKTNKIRILTYHNSFFIIVSLLFIFVFYAYNLFVLIIHTKISFDRYPNYKDILKHFFNITYRNSFSVLTILFLLFLSVDPKINLSGINSISINNSLKNMENYKMLLYIFSPCLILSIIDTNYSRPKNINRIVLNLNIRSLYGKRS